MQFQVGIYHEKFQHDKIQYGRPAATSDHQIFSLTLFTQHFFILRSKNSTIYIYLTNSSDRFEIGQEKLGHGSNMCNIWKTGQDS